MSNIDHQSEEAAEPIQARKLLYNRGIAIPAETMLIGNLRASIPDIEVRFATEIGSAFVLLGNLRKTSSESSSLVSVKYRLVYEAESTNPAKRGFLSFGLFHSAERSPLGRPRVPQPDQ